LNLPPIYAITDRRVSGIADPVEIARRLLNVGVRAIQVREKESPDPALLATVEKVESLGRPLQARILVNDRADVARLAGVGVHLGPQDLTAREARRLLAREAVVGVSTHDLEAARRAFADEACDYVAFGPVFASGTKPGRAPRGLDALAEAGKAKTKPLVAIGGVTEATLDAVFDAGADSAAMIGALLLGGAIEENARRLLDRARRRRAVGRIYLIGFMGSGKTTVGRRVAERLGLPFVDLDTEIEKASGLTIRRLFEESGEAAFRQRESVFLSGTESLPSAVIATGGGSFVQSENQEMIQKLGTAIFLDVPFETILERLSGKNDRPLFAGPEQAGQLFAQRDPFYRMGSITVALSKESVEEAADRVLRALFDRWESPVRLERS
jgi:thiamine-phosphate diphosphorylase